MNKRTHTNLEKGSINIQENILEISKILSLFCEGVGILGTKRKYAELIITNGVNHPNTTLFGIESLGKKPNYKQFFFTILMSVYHAISLEVQYQIRSSGNKDFIEYYTSNPTDLPALILIDDEIPKKIVTSFGNRYKHVIDSIQSDPYGKIKEYGKISPNGILKKIDFTLEDIRLAQKNIVFAEDIICGNSRFFYKAGSTAVLSKFTMTKILSDSIIFPFCNNLTRIAIEKIKKAF